jgi:flagellar hook assembly protein FlgD
VNVVDVHVVRSSPTLVGKLTAVAAQPYNLSYRLSEDATMIVAITSVTLPNIPLPCEWPYCMPIPYQNTSLTSSITAVRHLVNGLPRVGEGYPGGSLQNSDAWDGRYDNGDLAPPGNYSVFFQAQAADQYGLDVSMPYTYPLSIDPLQITDIAVTPLEGGSTSLAVIGYTLTEPATTFLDIYPPGTQFCPQGAPIYSPLASVNNPSLDFPNIDQSKTPPKNFFPSLDNCNTTLSSPIQHIVEFQPSRTPVKNWWDGRDSSGQLLPDGNYVYVLYGELASQNGYPFYGNLNDSRIWTSVAKNGFIPVARGLVGISQITPVTTVVGSSPPVAGINPFHFNYSLTRDADVKVDIFNEAASTITVRHLVLGEARPGKNFPITETWDGNDDNGYAVSSGTYLVELRAWDPAFPSFVSTTTALFPVDMFRTTNVNVVPLLTGTTASSFINYILSNPMYVGINIYNPGTVISSVTTSWPPCEQVVQTKPCPDVYIPGVPALPIPFYTIYGMRAGGLMVSDSWSGIDQNGILMPDGNYPFTLIAQSSVPTEGGASYSTDRIVGIIPVVRGLIGVPYFNVDPTLAKTFFSSETIELDPFTISYELTRPSSVTINVVDEGNNIIRNVVLGEARGGGVALQDVWDGRDNLGNFPPPAFYTIIMTAEDVASKSSSLSLSTSASTVNYWPIQIYDLAVSPVNLQNSTAKIFYQVSEPMKVAILIYRPGTQFPDSIFGTIGHPQPPALSISSAPISLVKVLVSVQPPRQQVETDWDGTDLTFAKVPNGTYRFTIVGSTDITAIDTITGKVNNENELSVDQYIDDLPVVRNASLDPQGDFDHNTFAYPNPASGPVVNFSVWVPFQGDVFLRIYTIAGEMVFEHDFGQVPPAYNSTTPLIYVWNKANEAGRPVAKGIYYAVFQAQETYGNKNFVQVVKKVLIP